MGSSTYIAPAGATELMKANLNALANDTVNVGATIIDNTTNRYFYAIFELELASVDLSSQNNPAVELYLVPSYDDTNYADTGTDASATVYPPTQYLVAVLGVAETSAAHRAVSPHVMLDPVKYTPVVINKTGAALATTATDNILNIKTYTVTTA